MEVTPAEWLLALSSVIVLPMIVILVAAYARGFFSDTEAVKYLMLEEPEVDYWAPGEDAGGRREAAAPTGGDPERGSGR